MIGRFITPDSIVQSPADPQSLNRYTYCWNNPVLFTDPTGHFWQIIVGIIIGAALNSSIAAIQGQDVGMAALMGAISGGFFAGAGMVVKAFEMTAITAAGVHAAAGGASGAINAGITEGDVLQSATISAVSAGVAKYAMAGILPEFSVYQDAGEWGQFAMEGTTAVATGTVTGGVSAEIIGGDFADGAAQGAWTLAYGFAFNGLISKYGNRAIMLAEQTKAGRWISGLSNRPGIG